MPAATGMPLEPVPGAPYTSHALARLALAGAAMQLSDLAGTLVTTGYDPAITSPADPVAQARALLRTAEHVLTRAVVFAREQGASWAEIGTALDITRQSAHQRWAQAERAGNATRTAPPERAHDGFDAGAADAAQWAARLDSWVTSRRDSPDSPHPISRYLRRMSPADELRQIAAHRRSVLSSASPDPALLAQLDEREAVIYEALVAARPNDAPQRWAAAARHARQAAAAHHHKAARQRDVRTRPR